VIWLKPKRKIKKKEESLGAHSRLPVFGFYSSIVVDVEAADVGRVRQGSKEVQLGVAKYLRRSASYGEFEQRRELGPQRRRAPCCPGCSELLGKNGESGRCSATRGICGYEREALATFTGVGIVARVVGGDRLRSRNSDSLEPERKWCCEEKCGGGQGGLGGLLYRPRG
jgi:hypothetical protein